MAGDTPQQVRATDFLAEEIFFNLIDNAVNTTIRTGPLP
jgi:hypothetical protein